MTGISKNESIDKLGDIVDNYNNTYHRAIYNLGHNILILFDILPNFSFTASETKCDY